MTCIFIERIEKIEVQSNVKRVKKDDRSSKWLFQKL